MADFHAADLWVAVVPETSQVGPAMEQAGKEAKGKFGDAVKGIGKNIHDEFDKIGDKAKEKFGKAGKTAGDAFNSEIGKELRNTVSEAIEPHVKTAMDEVQKVAVDKAKDVGHGITKSIGDAIGGSFGNIAKELGDSLIESGVDTVAGRLRDRLSGVKDSVDEARRSFALLKDGKYGDVFKQIDDNAEKLPDPLKKIHDQVQPVRDAFQGIKDTGKDVIDTFAGLEIIAPGLAAGLAKMAVPLGEIAGSMAMVPEVDKWLKSHTNLPLPSTDDWNWFKAPFRQMGGLFMHPSRLGKSGMFDRDTGNYIGPGSSPGSDGWAPHPSTPGIAPRYTATPGSLDPFAALNPPTTGIPSIAPTDVGGVPSGGAGWAQHPSSPWSGVAKAESGGNWQTNTGNGYYGGLQFDQNTWNDFGGRDFAPRPDLATPDQQIAVADRVPTSQRAGRWPNTYKNYGAGGSGGGGGLPSGGLPNVRGAHPQLAYALAAAKQMFPDLQLTAGKDDHPMDQGWHPRGQAIDIGGGTPQEQAAFSNYLLQFAPSIEELIHSGPGVTQNIKSGRVGPAIDMPGSVYNSGQAGYHGDHVHLAVKDEMAQAFEAALGGGGLQAPGLNGRGPNGQIPTGAEHDPLYVTQASSGSGGGGGSSPLQSQGQQLGQGLLGGLMQSIGLDGSVFGGKSPMDFGAVKLGSGLLNYGMGLMNSMAPGSGGGGSGGGLGGLAGLIPGVGAAISAAAGPGGGSLGIGQQVGGDTHIHQNQPITINNPTGDPYGWLRETQWYRNSSGMNPPGSSGRTNLTPVPTGR